MIIDKNGAAVSHKARTHTRKHEPGWRRAHASSTDNKTSYSTTLRQLPPRMKRVLLVL